MMPFEPVAIVGRGCVLPGCLTPAALWAAVAAGHNLIAATPAGQWGSTPASDQASEQSIPQVAGFISGFAQVFDPERHAECGVDVRRLDPVVQWPLHAASQAWRDAGQPVVPAARKGVVLANLSYPSRGKADFCSDCWLDGKTSVPAMNAFNSGLPALLIARALGATGTAFALDAACASSLYAVRIACRKLQLRHLDVALACAVNAADGMMLLRGFGALQALSPSGRSQPFAAAADGLVPAHGAAALVLKRLCDVQHGEPVYGVIRGIGLSNDGRRGGFLVPDGGGQLEAMRRAYATAAIQPDTIDYLECHATGTVVGDAVEIHSCGALFAERENALPAGSLKSNTGHLITVAGLASMIKLTLAMEHETLAPTRLEGAGNAALAGSCLQPQRACAPWPDAPLRRAAVSNFGFGGNNAHLILEAHPMSYRSAVPVSIDVRAKASIDTNAHASIDEPLVVCGIGALAGPDRGVERIVRRLMSPPEQRLGPCPSVAVDPLRARTPPDDLRHAEAQHLALLAVVDEAWHHARLDDAMHATEETSVGGTSADRIGVYVGMGCASDSARWLLRERLAERLGETPKSPHIAALQASIVAPMCAADVLGAMPNLTANRINAAFDCRSQGFAVSAEGNSGLVAWQLACEAILDDEIDIALVAAADFASEPLRTKALALSAQSTSTTDLACSLVLMRASLAQRLGMIPLADFETSFTSQIARKDKAGASDDTSVALLRQVYGSAPIADSLFEMVAAIGLAARGQQLGRHAAEPALSGQQSLTFSAGSGFAPRGEPGVQIHLQTPQACASPDPVRPVPHLFWACAGSVGDLRQQLLRREPSGQGDWRLVIVADDQAQLQARFERAEALLSSLVASLGHDARCGLGDDPSGSVAVAVRLARESSSDGLYLGCGAPCGELAFVYTGSAAAYPRMGRGLFMAYPELAERIAQAFPETRSIAHLLARPMLSAHEQLCSVTLLSQAHTLMLRDFLGLIPDALLGLSLGETNALIAFGFWQDAAALLDEIAADEMYEKHLGGRFDTAALAWGSSQPVRWENWRLYAPVDDVQQAIGHTQHTDITIIYSNEDCVIGGPAEECAALVRDLDEGSGVLMNQNLIVHTRTLQPYANTWRALHTRPTVTQPDVRVYSHADHASYSPTRESVADRLTRQALQTIDFRRTVEQAYADGVRSFVEIGPGDILTRSVGKILGSQCHLAVATDRIEQSDVGQITHLAGALFAEGRAIDLPAVAVRLDAVRGNPWRSHLPAPSAVVVPAHFEPPGVAGTACASRSTVTMPRAPELPVPRHALELVGTVRTDCPVDVPIKVDAANPAVAKGAIHRCQPVGPAFERHALEQSTVGSVSDMFGERFRRQDDYVRQVRLPAPPLLLVDRILGIEAEPGVAGIGRIWTETDIVADSWCLHAGVMRPGPLIEAGQADLSLISWMGADFRNQDKRVYRLLGCELTLHSGVLPRAGDTLRYQIEITGHASVSGVHLFFFQYDCHIGNRLLFSVRNGQAGFFTAAELSAGTGVLTNLTEELAPGVDPASIATQDGSAKRAFTSADLDALRGGDAYACFGAGFELCAAHSRTPRLPAGRLALLDEIEVYNPVGGPRGQGYLRAIATVPTDAWFYAGHFHNDPCMPGTLMAEAAVQALEFLALALGFGRMRDGWLFDTVPELTAKFECRGQVVPDATHRISYEVFVIERIDGDSPQVHAALLASSDGHKVFHCPHFAIRLCRHWPAVTETTPPSFIGPQGESRGDRQALLACGNGAPSAAFGEMYRAFDQQGRVPRLPQPPYHMISRVLSVSTRPDQAEAGARVTTEFDVDEHAWYFVDNRNGCMPIAVLMEIILQPCGWLASHSGFALLGGECFRNLDGDGQVLGVVSPTAGHIQVDVTMTRFYTVGSMSIVHFELMAVLADGSPVFSLDTSFGFFPMAALTRQAGLPISKVQQAQRALPVSLQPIEDSQALLPTGRLQMLDKVDHFDATGGSAGLGLIRARQSVDPYAWYFKAHFFQDPVQPGSLGVDALQQTLLRAILLKGLVQFETRPDVQSPATLQPMRWRYRGQVTPNSKQVSLIVEITTITEEPAGLLVLGTGHLWCDALRIYEVENLSIRLLTKAGLAKQTSGSAANLDPNMKPVGANDH